MIVYLQQELWEPGQMAASAVISFCLAADAECHALLSAPPWDETDPTQPISRWLIRHGWQSDPPSEITTYVAELLRAGLERFTDADRPGVSRISVGPGPTDWPAGHLAWPDALELLRRPLVLFVEGKENDGAFVQRMADSRQRQQLEAALSGHQARFEGRSGIDGIIRALEGAKTPTSRGEWLTRLRLWVLFDRDGHEDDRTAPGAKSQRAHALLTGTEQSPHDRPWPVPGWQLTRRTIENYVPLSTLSGWWLTYHRKGPLAKGKQRERVAKVEAFAKLPSEMRRLFNMKKGLAADAKLSKERRAAVRDEGAPLTEDELPSLPEPWRRVVFDDLDETERAALHTGFPVLTDAWHQPKAISKTWPAEPGIPPDEQKALVEEGRALIESILRSL